MGRCRVSADIGGTFTDIVVAAPGGAVLTRKVSSTAGNYEQAIVEGLTALLGDAGMELSRVSEFLHGTTVPSNTILELKGARIGLIATEGFRDILEIRNLRMPRLYDIGWEKPAPLVERYLRLTVAERISASGAIDTPLERRDVEDAARRLIEEGVEAIAVCLINSYVNPAHEQMVGEIIAELAPGLPICLSSDVLPQIKEYERTSTTVVNAYLLPVVSTYLRSLTRSLEQAGMKAPVLVMQSNGSLTPLEEACRHPVNIVESGPAAGVVGAVARARQNANEDIISFDMGGTTAKASLAEHGQFTLSQQYSVGGGIMVSSRLLTGAGYLLAVPSIDIAEVGAGGGSIVSIDAGGSIQVGPESAGAMPGPMCYDIGGERPTVTDANIVLGYLNPDHLLDGALPLNAERSRRGFEQHIARPLNVDFDIAAYATRKVAVTSMIRAIRAVSSERGRDPRLFTLFAFGGNGALFAADMAEELGMRRILVPPSAGVFSALGMLHADVGHYYSHTIGALLGDIDEVRLRDSWRDLENAARLQLAEDGFPDADVRIGHAASLRYKGQAADIAIPLNPSLVQGPPLGLATAFSDEHERSYGHRAGPEEPVQLVNIQVFGCGLRGVGEPTLRFASRPNGSKPPLPRAAYFGPRHGWLQTPVVRRAALSGGHDGPCIVEEYDTTCLVPPGAKAFLAEDGNLLIEIGQERMNSRGGTR